MIELAKAREKITATIADQIDDWMQSEEVRVNGWTARQLAEIAVAAVEQHLEEGTREH